MPRRLVVAVAILFCGAFVSKAAIQGAQDAERFVRDPNKPFVYLKFDHIGSGVRRSDGEPPTRIWLRFVNNCTIAILLRTYGVPEGSIAGEIGVMDQVVPDAPMLTITSTPSIDVAHDTDPKGNVVSATAEPSAENGMPSGYISEVSGMTTVAPGQSVLFSVPTTHVGFSDSRWHMEIPFRFNMPKGKGPRDPLIGGEPDTKLLYSHFYLPKEAQAAIEKLK